MDLIIKYTRYDGCGNTILNGINNCVSGSNKCLGVIVNGRNNDIFGSSQASIINGFNNVINGAGNTLIGGGTDHTLTGFNSTILNGSCNTNSGTCLLYTSPSPRDRQKSRMPSSA